MQLGNIKNKTTLVNDKHRYLSIDDGNLHGCSQRATTTADSAPGSSDPPSLMSLTNILIQNSAAKHLRIPERSQSAINIRTTSTKRVKDNSRLRFNVCGENFEILESTAQRYPNTLLADSAKREKYWDEENQEFYLDRNRACFESVLTYYQSNGILIRPQNIPDVLFLRELQFYDLGEDVLQKVRGMSIQYVFNNIFTRQLITYK